MPLRSSSAQAGRNSYIPSSVGKSISDHMDRTLPSHLKKYSNQTRGAIPRHAEAAITKHMEKTLPGHLKQYANPFVQQNIVYGSGNPPGSPSTQVPNSSGKNNYTNSSRYVGNFSDRDINQPSSGQTPNQISQPNPTSGGSLPPESQYDFIMNPGNGKKPSPIKAPDSKAGKLVILVIGLILLIILVSVAFSFLNASSNKQKDNLLNVVQTQSEIIRVIDEGNNDVASLDLLNRAVTLRAVIATSQQDAIQALENRGKEVKDKDISVGADPANDAKLEEGLSTARFDQTYEELLDSLLNQYSDQLQDVYDNGGPNEKAFSNDAFNQAETAYIREEAETPSSTR